VKIKYTKYKSQLRLKEAENSKKSLKELINNKLGLLGLIETQNNLRRIRDQRKDFKTLNQISIRILDSPSNTETKM
jgi:acetate kinase